ncbi:hypothetical protein MCAV_07570 [[Mycoplasma] cavipharyngis]|uniref:hypothetical protein n=1 Tax=[Mycoplasma] cavipharyngis TaxID=92757 RepID=UPI0037039762
MNSIQQMLNLTYDQCCEYLKQKHGLVKKNYFSNEQCLSSVQSIKRTKTDGLFIHHIDEDKAIMLSDPKFAIKNPFAYQLANRLVYCDYLEHLVLHIKILEYPHKDKNPHEKVGYGGIFNFLIPELNDIYSNCCYQQIWKKKAIDLVINRKSDYLLCLKYLMTHFDIPFEAYTNVAIKNACKASSFFIESEKLENLVLEINDLYQTALATSKNRKKV